VRKRAGIPFEGDAYLQDFLLGDVEVDGLLERAALHSFALRRGVAVFFPLGSPTTWRVIAAAGGGGGRRTRERGLALAPSHDTGEPDPSDLSLEELQKVVDDATGGGLTSAIRRGSATSGCIIARPRTTVRAGCSSPATPRTSTARSAPKE